MKSRSQELFEKSIAAIIAEIEVYNKPDFKYREETFAVLALNSWELLLKAQWLKQHKNKLSSLYVYEKVEPKAGGGTKQRIKRARSGNAFTHSIDFLAKKLIEKGLLDQAIWANIQAIEEIRDSSIHFYNKSDLFSLRLQEIGTATLKNFVALVTEWFDFDLGRFNFYLMPLSFVIAPKNIEGLALNKEERNVIRFVEALEKYDDPKRPYTVSVSIDIKFQRSKSKDALKVQISKDPDATKVHFTEEQIKDRCPWNYSQLTSECRRRYEAFKLDGKYHSVRKKCLGDSRYSITRTLDPDNLKSPKINFFNPTILKEFDKHYKVKA
jgi:hypothetical protein